MKRANFLAAAVLVAVVIWLVTNTPRYSAAAPTPHKGGGDVDPALEQALQKKLAGYQSKLAGADEIGFTIDTAIPASDGLSEMLWLAPVDNATGEIIATEPALAIGVKGDMKSPGWQIILPSDSEWAEHLDAFPREELPEELQTFLYGATGGSLDATLDGTVYRGYKLPWAADVSKRLSGSIGHFKIYNSCNETSCRYAYDFADGTMFPLLAAKGGDIWMAKWDCPNGETSCSNYLVIRDQSTTPTTYQLYLHLAYNSIPPELRTRGTPVMQGQYIGNADDTGYSTGHHLHFHVHTTSTWYWGNSVDIRFDDVSINDGTPRTCYEASHWPEYGTQCADSYISGNVGANPGTATLSLPANGSVISTDKIRFAGTAADDRGVVKVQAVARRPGEKWVEIGSPVSGSNFDFEVNTCSGNLPNGVIDVAVRVFDYEGNISVPQGVRSVVKSYNCPPPTPAACAPSADQITIYSEPNYLGACKKLGISSSAYSSSSFSPVADRDIASIQVGANIRAFVSDTAMSYNTTDPSGIPIITGSGRIEGLEVSDPNLADNPVGSDTITSLIVQAKTKPVAEIDDFKFPPIVRWTPATFTTQDSIGISFYEPGGVLYKAWAQKWNGSAWVDYRVVDNVRVPGASLGSFLPGHYRFLGCAKTSTSSWGCGNTTPAGYEFDVSNAPFASQTVKSFPYTDELNTASAEWTLSGLWRWSNGLSEGRQGYIYNNGTNYATGTSYGSLTSPLIQIPGSGSPSLRFQYRYATESSYPHWDQRWVQIAEDGGEFVNVLQLWDDPTDYWLTSQEIDLSAYRGKKIRVRFFFFTVDSQRNAGSGWQIDQISIGSSGLHATCADGNNSLATATPISINQSVSGNLICPAGDVDYFKFNGNQGDRLGIWLDAFREGSTLDPVLALLDSNGSLIYENDDQVPYEMPDSLLSLNLPATGTYYLKVKAWDHPSGGGQDYPYTLHLYRDAAPPVVQITTPGDVWPTDRPFPIVAEGSEADSRIMQMDFYWHPADWQGGTWELIGRDYSGADGWTIQVNPVSLGNLKNSALYVEARDAGGNISGAIRIASQVDSTPPVIQWTPLPNPLKSTVAGLNFYVYDLDTGVKSDSIILQISEDGGSTWSDIPDAPPSQTGSNQAWFVGEPGKTYKFRVQATDLVGNQAQAEVSTSIEAACQPDGYESGDDGGVGGAVSLPLGQPQEHNFCPLADVDWVIFEAEAGKNYFTSANTLGGGAAFRLELYDTSGSTLIASTFSSNLGQPAAISWKAPASGQYALKIEPVADGLAGTDMRYQVSYSEGILTYFPLVGR